MQHTPDTARRAALAFMRTRRWWLPSFKLPPLGFWQVLQRGDPRTWAWGPRLIRGLYVLGLGFWFLFAARVVLVTGIDSSSIQLSKGPAQPRMLTWVFAPPKMADRVNNRPPGWTWWEPGPDFVSLAGMLSIAGEEHRNYSAPGPEGSANYYTYPGTLLLCWADRAILLDRARPAFTDALRAAAIALSYLVAMCLLPYVLRVVTFSRSTSWSGAPGEELLRRDESQRSALVATTWITTVAAGSAPILVTASLFAMAIVLPWGLIPQADLIRSLLLGLAIFAVPPLVGAGCLLRLGPGEHRARRCCAFICIMLLVIGFAVALSTLGSAIWSMVWMVRGI